MLNHFLDNALAKTVNIISFFQNVHFYTDFRRRSYMIGTFTKNLTKGCGINEWQMCGLIDI